MAEKENLAGENPKTQKKTSTNWTNIIITIAIVAVFAVLIGQPALTGNASLCIVTNPGQQSVQEVSEREPYTVYKDVEEPFNYNIVSHYDGYVTYNYVNKKYGKLEIKNTEDHSGIFTVKSIFTDGEKKTEQVLSYDISPETIRLFSVLLHKAQLKRLVLCPPKMILYPAKITSGLILPLSMNGLIIYLTCRMFIILTLKIPLLDLKIFYFRVIICNRNLALIFPCS